MAIGNASAFAPDAAKAEESAKQIFKLIDLVPQVDAESEEGTKLDKVLFMWAYKLINLRRESKRVP